MRPSIFKVAVLCLLNASLCGIFAQGTPDPKKGPKDAGVDAPPSEPVNAISPANPSKSRRTAINTKSRSAQPEVKAYTFANRPMGVERSKTIVVRSGKPDAKATAQIQEDLAVMSRILEKSVADYKDDREEAAGIQLLMQGGRPVRALYLEEYGVVFTLSVNVPLKPEPRIDETEEKRQNNANEEWNDARSELFGERRWPANADKAGRRPFDPHQVEDLRDSLIDALRNASNIRHLKDTDWVTVVVRGRSMDAFEARYDVLMEGNGRVMSLSGEDHGSESTLVLRVKKSDLDDSGKKKGNAEEFKRKVSITSY